MEIATLRETLKQYGQEHLLQFEQELSEAQRQDLYAQISRIDFPQLQRLFEQSKQPPEVVRPDAVAPIDVQTLPATEEEHKTESEAYAAGIEALKDGRVAAVLVAGGQGSRLGFEHPKGMFPIGPVRETPLFQIHAEKILAWSRKVKRPIPWFIMTSPINRRETEDFLKSHDYFGLPAEHVYFFEQGTMPAVDAESGRVLLEEKGKLFASPNGHGGSLKAMRDDGVLEKMAEYGADLAYYFQVDNVNLKILDPAFLGRHLLSQAELTTKVVRKEYAEEKVGLVVLYDGKPTIIEYSDLPAELARKVDERGELLLWPGSIAIHVFDRAFLERITGSDLGLPYHFARKKVPYLDENGQKVQPAAPNAVKFEMFVFDAMPMARKVAVVETSRRDEYEPVKNARGDHSPEEVRRAIASQAGQWLKAAGVEVPVGSDGRPAFPLEISPLAGLNSKDFAQRLLRRDPPTGPTYYSAEDARDFE